MDSSKKFRIAKNGNYDNLRNKPMGLAPSKILEPYLAKNIKIFIYFFKRLEQMRIKTF